MRVGGDGAGAGGRGSPTPGSARLHWGPGGGESSGRASEGGRNAAESARGERGNVDPELGSWRRAVPGDVTALESEECRAAGAPSAGPGEVAHF